MLRMPSPVTPRNVVLPLHLVASDTMLSIVSKYSVICFPTWFSLFFLPSISCRVHCEGEEQLPWERDNESVTQCSVLHTVLCQQASCLGAANTFAMDH